MRAPSVVEVSVNKVSTGKVSTNKVSTNKVLAKRSGRIAIAYPSMRQLVGLRSQVTGYADIEPALELGGQSKNFDGHGGIPLQFR
jgi:hypothetical protein